MKGAKLSVTSADAVGDEVGQPGPLEAGGSARTALQPTRVAVMNAAVRSMNARVTLRLSVSVRTAPWRLTLRRATCPLCYASGRGASV